MGGSSTHARRAALSAALAIALSLASSAPALATTYYSAPNATDPTRLESWWTYPDSTGASPPDFASGDMFVVQEGQSMATTETWAISGEGSALWIQPGAVLAVGDGAAHRLELTGSTFQLDPGATYVHDTSANWDSTCFKPGVTWQFNAAGTVVLRATETSPGTDIAWGNLVVDLTTDPGADWSWDGHLTRVNGDLTVTSTGGRAMRLASDSNCTVTLLGSLIIGGGDLELGAGAGATTLNIAGDFTMTAGTFGSSGPGIHTVVFWGGMSPRTFTQSGGSLAIANVNWKVDTETLVLASAFRLPALRTFTVGSTGTLALAAALTNTGSLVANGTLRLEPGGSLSEPVSYGGAGRLVYAAGEATIGPEWGLPGPGAPLNVVLATGGGSITLSDDRTLLHSLVFSSGVLITGPDTLTLGPGCTVAGGGGGGYVRGNLARIVPAAFSGPVVFDIGDSVGYAPVDVVFGAVSGSGTITASTARAGGPPAAGDPPAGSGLSQERYVDRVWALTNSETGPVLFDTCAVVLHFGSGDMVGGADPNAFLVARDSAGTWSQPVVASRQPTATAATGLTAFGDFRVGESFVPGHSLTVTTVGPGTVLRDPDLASYPEGSTVVLTAIVAKGWAFAGWSGDTTGLDNPLALMMDRDWSVTATFRKATVVISQVYGGGGTKDAPFTHDFVELFNRGALPVDVTGWTVQYAAATDSVWSATVLAGTIPAGGYYLVREARGPGGTDSLPTPDAIGTINLAAKGGKVALVRDATLLRGTCPDTVSIVDFVGYDGADCAEGAPTAALSNVTAAMRERLGCEDTDDNLSDFAVVAPAPRNSLAPVHWCEDWVGVEPAPVATLALAPVAPNPTRGEARIAFALPAASSVRLRVLDLQGRVVATLLDGALPAGRHEARWDGAARSGLYFVRLEACGQRAVRSVIRIH